jgi:hypothetical protein
MSTFPKKEEKKEFPPPSKPKYHNTPKKESMEMFVEYMLDDADLDIRFWHEIPNKKHPESADEKHSGLDDFDAIIRLLQDKLRVYKHVEFKPSSDDERGQIWQYRDDGEKKWHCKMNGEKKWTKEDCGPPDMTNTILKAAGKPEDPRYPPALV